MRIGLLKLDSNLFLSPLAGYTNLPFRLTVREVGGLDRTFFMQAEEYDLSFRLLAAGGKVEIFGDLAVDHWKTPQARRSILRDRRQPPPRPAARRPHEPGPTALRA